MGFGAPLHWIVLVLIIVLLFGSGRISGLMGDVAKGIKSFKKGMAEEEAPKPAPRIEAQEAARPASETVIHDEQKTPR
jgi:sec-independent protein translocase protein TatA